MSAFNLRSLDAALLRYRVMAYVVGTGLVILVCVGVPLKYVGDHPIVVQIVGPLHGFLYIVYVLLTLDLMVRCRWPLYVAVPVAVAGTVPFLTFVAEHYVTRSVRVRIAERAATAAAAAAAPT